MKIALQYLNDANGNTQAVQLPVSEWDKLLAKLKRYEQALKLKSDLKEAYQQVALLRSSKAIKPNLKDFLNEL